MLKGIWEKMKRDWQKSPSETKFEHAAAIATLAVCLTAAELTHRPLITRAVSLSEAQTTGIPSIKGCDLKTVQFAIKSGKTDSLVMDCSQVR